MTRILLLVTLSVLTATGPAMGQTAGVVVLSAREITASDGTWTEIEPRIAAELRLMGFQVVVAEHSELTSDDRFSDLATSIRSHQAVAAVTVAGGEDHLEIWIWVDDGAQGRAVHDRIDLDLVTGPDREGQVAIALAEVLHANLLDLDLTARSPTPRPPAPPPPEPTAEPEPIPEPEDRSASTTLHAFRATGGLGAVVPLDPAYGMGTLQVGGGYRPVEWLVIDADARITLSPYVVEEWNGRSESYLAMLCAFVTFEPWPRARFSPGLGLGGGLLVAWTRGEARAWFEGNRDATAVGLVSASLHLGFGLTPSLRLVVRLDVDVAVPDIKVRFAREPAAVIGRPLLDVVVGIEWGLGRSRNRGGS